MVSEESFGGEDLLYLIPPDFLSELFPFAVHLQHFIIVGGIKKL